MDVHVSESLWKEALRSSEKFLLLMSSVSSGKLVELGGYSMLVNGGAALVGIKRGGKFFGAGLYRLEGSELTMLTKLVSDSNFIKRLAEIESGKVKLLRKSSVEFR